MKTLSKEFEKKLKAIEEAIQSSEELAQFLDTEEEEIYQSLREKFEPQMLELYENVAAEDPLQLLALEEQIIEGNFEGLFLSRLLGYSVLRGDINENYKYYKPQDQFKKILLSVCESANYDILKQRIGQSVQVGFALSSDIWITNLIEEVENKKIKLFLRAQKIQQYRDLKYRRAAYQRFAKQFKAYNFYTTEFAANEKELLLNYGTLHKFVEYRIQTNRSHAHYIEELIGMLEKKDMWGMNEHLHILILTGHFIDLANNHKARLSKVLDELRKQNEEFTDEFFSLINQLLRSDLNFTSEEDKRFLAIIGEMQKDDLYKYYFTLSELANKGFMHQDVLDLTRKQYNSHEGLSTVNDCLRRTILNKFRNILNNLSVEEYPEYFELNKIFAAYMDIFDFEQFNHSIKDISLKYIRKLLKHYTDKRGKDYQDIKKFVKNTFLDFGFMTEKQLKELFITKRKK